MLKTLITLARGKAAASGEALADRNALLILDQQIRDVAAGLERAKRALALALAADRREAVAIAGLDSRIADLELRVRAALADGAEAAARDGAEAIASLEADRAAAEVARQRFAGEAARLTAHVRDGESRLNTLERGRRGAAAAEAVRQLGRGRAEVPALHRASLSEAEATLDRLRARQEDGDVADAILTELDRGTGPQATADRLAEAGYGPRRRASADDVLARLKATPAF